MSEIVEANFTLTPADLRSFQRRHIFKSIPMLWVWIVFWFLLVFGANLFEAQLFYWLLDLGMPEGIVTALVQWLPFGLFLAFIIFTVVMSRWREKAKGKTRLAYLTQHVTISPEGVHIARDGITVDFAWRRVAKLRARKKVLDIYLDDRQAFLIPARAFPTVDAFDSFNRLVQQYWAATHPNKT